MPRGEPRRQGLEGEYEVPTVDGLKNGAEAQAGHRPRSSKASNIDQIDWKEFAENYSATTSHGATGAGSVGDDDDDRRPAIENIMVKRTLLPDHLMWQLRLSDMCDAEKEIGALHRRQPRSGRLPARSAVEEVAFLAERLAGHGGRRARAARVQQLDPPGVAARDLSECLLIQLRQLGLRRRLAAGAHRRATISPMLESRRFDRHGARARASPIEQIAEATKVISMLEPKPGRDFGDGETRYVTPDVSVHKVGRESGSSR